MNMFCGLEIDRKTNIISLVAFLLSVAGIAGQIYFFIQGPKVSLQSPEGVVLYNVKARDGVRYLNIIAPMAYVNTGQPGFNDAIKRETASVMVGDRTFNFAWWKYVASDSEEDKLSLNPKGDAFPVAVNAGSVETHETAFSALPIPSHDPNEYGINFIEFSEFEKLALAQKEILIIFNYETFAGTKGSEKCKIMINEAFRAYIKRGWISQMCAQ